MSRWKPKVLMFKFKQCTFFWTIKSFKKKVYSLNWCGDPIRCMREIGENSHNSSIFIYLSYRETIRNTHCVLSRHVWWCLSFIMSIVWSYYLINWIYNEKNDASRWPRLLASLYSIFSLGQSWPVHKETNFLRSQLILGFLLI